MSIVPSTVTKRDLIADVVTITSRLRELYQELDCVAHRVCEIQDARDDSGATSIDAHPDATTRRAFVTPLNHVENAANGMEELAAWLASQPDDLRPRPALRLADAAAS